MVLNRSGIYVHVDGRTVDMVYETSDEYFLRWLSEKEYLVVDKTPDIPLTPKERYDILKAFEAAGGVVAKIKDEWAEFERETSGGSATAEARKKRTANKAVEVGDKMTEDFKKVPFVSFGNDQLKKAPFLCETAPCPRCRESVPFKTTTTEDGQKGSLQFIDHCGGTWLVGIDGKYVGSKG